MSPYTTGPNPTLRHTTLDSCVIRYARDRRAAPSSTLVLGAPHGVEIGGINGPSGTLSCLPMGDGCGAIPVTRLPGPGVRRRIVAATVLLGTLAATGLLWYGGRARPTPVRESSGPPRLLRIDELSEAERRYGHSARRSPHVIYQPDVVILPAGAEAIRAAKSDGLTWTIDPDAEGADGIRPGKVLLLTSRAAGRVLGVRKEAGGLQVVLGPVEITEIVRDGEFTLDQPVDLSQAQTYTVPDMFAPVIPVAPVVIGSRGGAPEGLAGAGPCAPLHATDVPVVLASTRLRCQPVGVASAGPEFSMEPIAGDRGFGVRIRSNDAGVLFVGEAVLYLNTPKLHFNLLIEGGSIVTAAVRMEGVGGLLMSFESASPSPIAGNINAKRYAPIDWSFPVIGMGVPFAVTVRQQYELKTVFTSTGSLKARVYYELRGGLGVEYRDRKWSMGGPTGVKPVVSLDNLLLSTQGAAYGVTGMVMTHHAKVMVGVGAFGFATGPYGFLNSSVTVTRGSDLGIIRGPLACKQATLSMGVGAGVGYMMPEPVTKLINAFLRAINIRKEIPSAGGLQSDPVNIVSIGRYHPSLDKCGNK